MAGRLKRSPIKADNRNRQLQAFSDDLYVVQIKHKPYIDG